MKKISLFLMAFGLVAASCTTSDFENVYGEDPHADFSQAFVQTFGNNIDPDHDWGFGSSLRGAAMRAGADGYFERWQSDSKWTKPHDIIEAERDYVLQYLQDNPNGGYKTLDINTYVLQVVGGGKHSYPSDGPDKNGYDHTVSNATNEMNYCAIDGFFTQINNNEMNSEDCILIGNVPATNATYHDSYGSTWENHYAFYFITFPNEEKYGYMAGKTGCYLCYDFATYKSEEVWGVSADGIYDDWVIKLSPSDGGFFDAPKPNWVRIIAEDLGTIGDFDYNDVVFDAYIDNTKKAHIILRAAGGTMPLYVGNKEVHEAFGVSTTTMVNTGVKGEINYNLNDGKEIILDGTYENVINIPIIVRPVGKKEYELTVTRGAAPEKIAVTPDYEWTEEYKNIRETYPLFEDYVQNKDTKWY